MGLLIKSAAGSAGGGTDRRTVKKTKKITILPVLIPLFPTFALIAHYIVASERGIEALRTTIVFGMWSIIPYFYLLTFVMVLHRRNAPALRAGRRGDLLESGGPAADPRLEPFPLAQRSAAVDRERAAGDVAASEQIIDEGR